jgi:hypothetical protein
LEAETGQFVPESGQSKVKPDQNPMPDRYRTLAFARRNRANGYSGTPRKKSNRSIRRRCIGIRRTSPKLRLGLGVPSDDPAPLVKPKRRDTVVQSIANMIENEVSPQILPISVEVGVLISDASSDKKCRLCHRLFLFKLIFKNIVDILRKAIKDLYEVTMPLVKAVNSLASLSFMPLYL